MMLKELFKSLLSANSVFPAHLSEYLKAKGNTVDDRERGEGQTLLMVAVNKCYTNIVQLLISNKANVNTQEFYAQEFQMTLYPSNSTALMHLMASSHKDQKILQILLDAKADTNLKDSKGQTALHRACLKKTNTIDSIKLLLESGADKDSTDLNNIAPLYIAIREKNRLAAEFLMIQGASITYVDILDLIDEESRCFQPGDVSTMIATQTCLPKNLAELVSNYLPLERPPIPIIHTSVPPAGDIVLTADSIAPGNNGNRR